MTSTGGAISNPWFFADNCTKRHLEEHRSHSTRAASYIQDFPSKRFTISFYAMLPSTSSVRSTWPNGSLYPCVDSTSFAEVQSITVSNFLVLLQIEHLLTKRYSYSLLLPIGRNPMVSGLSELCSLQRLMEQLTTS